MEKAVSLSPYFFQERGMQVVGTSQNLFETGWTKAGFAVGAS